MKKRVDNNLEVRIPLAVDDDQREREQAAEKDPVLVVKGEHLPPRQTLLGPWHVQGQRFTVPLIPERYRDGILRDEQKLRGHDRQRECGKPECITSRERALPHLTNY